MKVLITDDQVPVVEGILKAINWEKIGVDKAVGAYSMKDAMEKFEKESFDVAVCDIQMPFGNGIELAEWIKDKNSQTEIIFLTSHAEFEYAQKAIKLSCFDYLVQPVEYRELEKCIFKALERVNEGRMAKTLIESGEHWNKNKSEMEEIFWRESLISSPDKDKMIQHALNTGIDLKLGSLYLPVLLVCQKDRGSAASFESGLSVRAMFDETLKYITLNAEYIVVEAESNMLFVAIEMSNSLEYERLSSQMKLFVNINRSQLGRDFECYIGEKMSITDMHSHYKRLLEMKEDNVMRLTDVFMAENRGKGAELDEVNYGEKWTGYFVRGQYDKVKTETENIIKKLRFEKKLGSRHLFAIFQKIMMSFYAAAEIGKYDIDEILKDEKYDFYYKKAMNPKDEEDVYEYLDYIAELNIESSGEEESGDIVKDICSYIDENLGNELTRDEIAGRFFLSKDYISHIFKDTMGVSLIDYINKEKIRVAKHLLKTTGLPIGIVSSKVGYSNFAYFSRVFKKYEGVSPNEYRRNV